MSAERRAQPSPAAEPLSAAEPLFVLEGLRFRYQERLVLDLPELAIQAGGVSVLVGPNGCGKTTLLKLINGLLRPSEGRVLYCGKSAAEEGLERLRGETVLVHQDPYLFDGSVFGNVSYALRLRRRPAPQVRRAVAAALSRVELRGFESRRARSLSGGERQRVAIARALVLDPQVLLLDEPTANVDPATTLRIEALVREMARAGKTVILSSHNPAFAYRLADRLITMAEGRLAPGRENVLRGSVEAADERFTYFRTGEQLLRCPAQEGEFTTAVLAADDVILSREAVETSAQNQLEGIVVDIESSGPRVRVQLDCGFPLAAEVTEYSRASLGIEPGERFYVSFKASAIRLY